MNINLVEFLKRSTLFGGLPVEYQQALGKYLKPKAFPKDSLLMNEGDPGDALYLVISGKVEVFTKDPNFGVEFTLATLGSHSVIGEMALLTDEKRTASVKALVDTQTLMLETNVFKAMLLKTPQVTVALAKILALRIGELNKSQGIPFVSPSKYEFKKEMFQLIPTQILERHKLLPLELVDETLMVGMVNPGDMVARDDLARCLRGRKVKPQAITLEDFQLTMKKLQRLNILATKSVDTTRRQKRHIEYYTAENQETGDGAKTVNITPILSDIIDEALFFGASDIHIETERDSVQVRYRVDGKLKPRAEKLPKNYSRQLMTRIKVLSSLDISERRLPQDGRVSLSVEDRNIDLRVSTIPSKYGEKAVLRILDSSDLLVDLNRLVIADKVVAVIRRMVFQNSGILLVTGPTGSGKTTTLYSMLHERSSRDPALNIVTVEDPIEYSLEGITQVQTNANIKFDFATVLRSFLRQDPDVILVGEMRDKETAQTAMEAALTGHFVLSSLHTTDTLGTIGRLLEMGVPSFQIANSMTGIINQRLARRNCPACTKQEELPDILYDDLVKMGVIPANYPKVFKVGSGCENCNNTGFKGRIGMYEVLLINKQLKEMIFNKASVGDMRKVAIETGALLSLEKYGGFLFHKGLIAPAEILRHISMEKTGTKMEL